MKKETSTIATFGDLLAASPAYLAKGAAIIANAEALKNPIEAKSRLAEAQKAVLAADPSGTDPELVEIKGLIAKTLTIY